MEFNSKMLEFLDHLGTYNMTLKIQKEVSSDTVYFSYLLKEGDEMVRWGHQILELWQVFARAEFCFYEHLEERTEPYGNATS